MLLVFGLGIVFMAIAFLVRRPWTIALPFIVWIGIDMLARLGILGGQPDFGSAVLAGAIDAVFSVTGIWLGSGQARRQARPGQPQRGQPQRGQARRRNAGGRPRA